MTMNRDRCVQHAPRGRWLCALRGMAGPGFLAAAIGAGLSTTPSQAQPTQAAAPAVAASAAAPRATAMPGPAFPRYTTAAQVAAACDAGLKDASTRVAALQVRKADVAWLAAFDELSGFIEDAYYPVSFIGNVHTDKAVRDAAQACDLKWADFSSTLGQNETLFRILRSIKGRDAVDDRFKRLAIESFEDAGVALPDAKRKRAKVISDRMAALQLDFEKNIRDANIRVAISEAGLKGVPADVVAAARRDASGLLLLGLDEPTLLAVLRYADDGQVREQMWRAKQNEGGDANLALLAELVKLRQEYARLFGVSNYADFVVRRRMAQSAARATKFLDELRTVVEAGEVREISELHNAKALHLNAPAAKLERWDLQYYSERVKRERYSVDQNAFRPYFPPQESVRFVMGIAERLFGIRYVRADAQLWHPDVQAYTVTDAATGKPLAGLMLDLYPREGKYNHAAVWSLRGSATLDQRAPRAALVVNLDRQGLTLDELETLLHEFGHALHNNLSSTRYVSQAGTSTLRDFVEAPSQMLEDWVYNPEVLATFKDVCATCKPVPREMIAQALKARDHGKATRYARQHLYASYDLALHAAGAPDPMRAWASMEGATPLGHVAGTRFPAGFAHVAGGYAAGYYGYLWSEVVAHDLRTAFATDLLSSTVGARYRNSVLAPGGQRAPQDLVRQFLGRDSNAKAFYNYLRQR